MHHINTIIKLFLSKSAGKLFSQALCFFAFAFQYEGFGQVKKPLALRLCLLLLTPKLFSHTPDNLCVATSASPIVNVRFLKYLSHSALFLSVQITYKSDLFSWFHKKKKTNTNEQQQKKTTKKHNHGKWYFFFLFEIAGFSATLLHISCLFSSLPAFEQICLDIHIQASPVLVCDVSSVLPDAVQLQSFLLLGSGLSGRAKLILRSWGCSPCKKGCWSHISAVTDVLFLRGRV